MVDKIVGKGEITTCQHFLFFPYSFQKSLFSRVFSLRFVSDSVETDLSMYLAKRKLIYPCI